MKKIIITIRLTVLFAIFPGLIFAENSSESDNDVLNELSLEGLHALPLVEIATGTAVPLEKAPSVATLITEKDIKAMGALTLDEILESVPGLHVSPSIYDSASTFSIRGIKTGLTPQVLVLLNGYRISSDVLTGTFPFLAKINVQNISRVEVIRGPGSAVYGADAYSGVINIITKTAKEIDGLKIGTRLGSNNTKNIWTQYGGNLGKNWTLAVNLEHFSQDANEAQKVTSDQQSIYDPLTNQYGYPSASLTPGYLDYRYNATTFNIHLTNPNWKVGLDGWVQKDNGTGAGNALAIDHKGHADIDQYLFTLEYINKELFENWNFSSKFSYQYIDAQYQLNLYPPGTVLPVGSDGNLFTKPSRPIYFPDGVIGNPGRKSIIPKLDLTLLYSGLNYHTWRFNFGIKKEKFEANATQNFGPAIIDDSMNVVDGTLTDITGSPYIYATDESRNIKYISIQDVWEIGVDWTLTAGVRYDYYSDFGSTTNSRIALVWSTTDEIITKFMFGSAFRAPSFAELYVQNNPVVVGNRNLAPEKINTYELSMSWQPNLDFTSNLSAYHFVTKDMIDFIPNSQGPSITRNDKSLTGKGLELEFKWHINHQWDLAMNYAYQQTKNKRTHEQIAYIPKQQFYFDLRWKFMRDWNLSSQVSWIADSTREDSDNRDPLEDYKIVNLNLRRQNIAKNWELAFSLKNVFNEDAREPSGEAIADDYRLHDRRAYLELRYHMR